MKQKLYFKLVRDRIPEVIEGAGKKFSLCRLPPQHLREYSLKKLQEEVQEFVENPCVEEAADIMEIFEFICDREGFTDAQIKAEQISKRVQKGGFNMGYILEWVEE
tara:strand:+ start:84 stop:401 length:318 start_codon:yes stop_codon:yes gene_type:complete